MSPRRLRARAPGRRRALSILALAGVLVLLAALLGRMHTRVVGEATLARMQTLDAEHLYRAEAAVARVANRLAKRPWEVRFYALGGLGSGPWTWHQAGRYRDADYDLWLQDVGYGGTPAVPGLVDVFVEVDYRDLVRQYHYRLTVLGPGWRRDRGWKTEVFRRPGIDISEEEGRERAADEASRIQEQAEANAATTSVVIGSVPGDPLRAASGGTRDCAGADDVAPEELLAEAMTAGPDRVEARREAARDLQRGIHLLGETAGPFQDLLPPLHRNRFRHRAPAFAPARDSLLRAAEAPDLDLRLTALLVLGESYLVQAWRRGPASDEGQEFLTRSREALERAVRVLEAATTRERARAGSTLPVTLFLSLARLGRIGAWPELVGTGSGRAREIAGECGGVHGAGADVDEMVDETLDPLDDPPARVRIGSDRPLPPTGFTPVSDDEVDDFLDSPGGGWAPWPGDAGPDEDFWEERWSDRVAREGEGGIPASSRDVDRDGDGRPDPDASMDGPDADGDGVADELPGDTAVGDCIAACVGVPGEPGHDACVDLCVEEGGGESLGDGEVPPWAETAPPSDWVDSGGGGVADSTEGAATTLPAGQVLTLSYGGHQGISSHEVAITASNGYAEVFVGTPGASLSVGPFATDVQVHVLPSCFDTCGPGDLLRVVPNGPGRWTHQVEDGRDRDYNDLEVDIRIQ